MQKLCIVLLALLTAVADAYALRQPMKMMFNFGRPSGGSASIPAGKKIAVVTGTTSGLGLETTRALLNRGDFHVVCANRDVDKMKEVAEREGFDTKSLSILPLDLGSFASTRAFAKKLQSIKSRPLDALVCNAAVYQPAFDKPKYSSDEIEQQLQINHLSHFLLCSLLLPDVSKAKKGRMIIVGSITGNTNTIGGGAVYPFADLGNLEGMAKGSKKPVAMIDGKEFNGAKAYKDSKICNMMTVNELHMRYHKSTGVTFASMYPGCTAETQLFREKRQWFRKLFPLFMKYVTGGYVSQREAGERLAQVVASPECEKSGVYWSWNGGARSLPTKDFKSGKVLGTGGSGGEIFENSPSKEVANTEKSGKMWDLSSAITGATWPKVVERERSAMMAI